MDNNYEGFSEYVHLHLCKDTYINVNDFLILDKEFERNPSVQKIVGFISPFTRLSKVLNHYLIGLDLDTINQILDRLSKYSTTQLHMEDVFEDLFAHNCCNIPMDGKSFYGIFIEPLKKSSTVFNRLGLEEIWELSYHTLSGKTLHDNFIQFSNQIYSLIHKHFQLPLIELHTLDVDITNEKVHYLGAGQVSEIVKENVLKHERKVESMRNEYEKFFRCKNTISYSEKKRLIENYSRDHLRTLHRMFLVNDREIIDVLESRNNVQLDTTLIERMITKRIQYGYCDVETKKSVISISVDTLLQYIFQQSAIVLKSPVIVTQEFSRNFDYEIYRKLSDTYTIPIISSAITTWKEDENIRFRGVKCMSFLYGLELIYRNYVQ